MFHNHPCSPATLPSSNGGSRFGLVARPFKAELGDCDRLAVCFARAAKRAGNVLVWFIPVFNVQGCLHACSHVQLLASERDDACEYRRHKARSLPFTTPLSQCNPFQIQRLRKQFEEQYGEKLGRGCSVLSRASSIVMGGRKGLRWRKGNDEAS